MSDHKEIFLSPDCGDAPREWCQDDVWVQCEECGSPSVKYIRADLVRNDRITELEAKNKKLLGMRLDELGHTVKNLVEARGRIAELKAGIQDYLNAEDVSIEMEMRRQLRTLLNQPGGKEG